MPRYINKETGAVVEFVGEAADYARTSGKYTPEDGGGFSATVEGVPVRLPAEATEFQGGKAGGAPGASEQLAGERAAFMEEMHGGAGQQALTFGEGLGSGLTLGLSDVVLDKVGAETEQRAEVNPGTRLGGELTGILVASLASGGSVGAATGAGKLAKVGSILAKTPSGAVSRAATKLGAAIGGVKGLVTAGAAEGAIYAAGQTASQMLVTDEPLSAEAVWATIGKNAAFGAGGGFVGGALAGGLGKGWTKLKAAKLSAPVVDMASQEGKAISGRMAEAVVELDTVADDLITRLDAPALSGFSPGTPSPQPTGSAALGDLVPSVENTKEVASRLFDAAKATGNQELVKEARKLFSAHGTFLKIRGLHPGQVDEAFGLFDQGARKLASKIDSRPAAADDVVEQLDPIREYHVNRRSYEINDKVRAGKALSDEEQQIMKGVEDALAKPEAKLAANTRLYRGVKSNVELPKVGDELADKAPAFATTDDAVGNRFRMDIDDIDDDVEEIKRGFLLEIDAKAGARGLPLNDFQKSVLLPANTKLRVTAVDPKTRIVSATLDGSAAPKAAAPSQAEAAAKQSVATELRAAQKAARKALGIDGPITGADIARLLKEPAETLGPKMKALDEYLSQARKLATQAGETDALVRFDAAATAMGEAASEATAGATGSALRDVAQGLGLYEGGEVIGGPVGDILQVAGAAKLVKGGSSKMAKNGASFLKRVVRGSARVIGGRGASNVLPGGRMASIAAYQVGSKAFGSLFDNVVGQRTIAGVTNQTVTRLATAFERLGRPAGAAVRTGGLSSTAVMSDVSFNYGQVEEQPKATDLRGAFKARSTELAACAANPMGCQQRIHDDLAELRRINPYVADELEMLAINIAGFLYEKMPKDPGTMNRLGQSTWKAPDHDIRGFGEFVKGATHPLETIEAAFDGRISPQAAEAVRTLFPNLFNQMQEQLAENAPALRKKLSLEERTRLSVLFQTPLDSTMDPTFRGFISEQNALRAQEMQEQQQTAGSSSRASSPTPTTGAEQLLA